ncbi:MULTISPECIES: DUF4376 domain-containing protein [Acinetobacter]|uniref:DUF4376 domain-containing protein n=1 Tax=Acinetobacter TaxID=469 RepID=UPI0002CDDD74|nr:MULTISPECIES: DUF4376 domain-containing protein [Acinetobacter]ENX29110.1 hypothetical protein F890_02212 [Acinetobacter sp. CIP 64.7]
MNIVEHVCVVDKATGRLLNQFRNVTDVMVEMNTPENGVAVLCEAPNFKCYWDFIDEQFIEVEIPEDSDLIFDYVTKKWTDPRSLDEIKAQRWTEIKSQRDQLEFGGFEFEGGIYDSDQVSQGRIMGAAAAGMDQVWTLADNTTTYLTANELVQLYQALQMHIAITHQRGRVAREAIVSATTKDDVDAVTL